jgi:hypothetical protein
MTMLWGDGKGGGSRGGEGMMVGVENDDDDDDETAHTAPILSLPLAQPLHHHCPLPRPPILIFLLIFYCYLVIYIIIYSVNLIYIDIVIVIKQTHGYPPRVQVRVYPGYEKADPRANPYPRGGYGYGYGYGQKYPRVTHDVH